MSLSNWAVGNQTETGAGVPRFAGNCPAHYNEAMQEAVIIDCLRTPVGKAPKGTLRNTRPDDLAALVFQALLKKYPQVPVDEIDDVILGCANPEAESGMNVARIAALRAGLPD